MGRVRRWLKDIFDPREPPSLLAALEIEFLKQQNAALMRERAYVDRERLYLRQLWLIVEALKAWEGISNRFCVGPGDKCLKCAAAGRLADTIRNSVLEVSFKEGKGAETESESISRAE